jgi:hypothetical protein
MLTQRARLTPGLLHSCRQQLLGPSRFWFGLGPHVAALGISEAVMLDFEPIPSSCRLMSCVLSHDAIQKFMVVGGKLCIADGFFSLPKTIFCNAEVLVSFGRVSHFLFRISSVPTKMYTPIRRWSNRVAREQVRSLWRIVPRRSWRHANTSSELDCKWGYFGGNWGSP